MECWEQLLFRISVKKRKEKPCNYKVKSLHKSVNLHFHPILAFSLHLCPNRVSFSSTSPSEPYTLSTEHMADLFLLDVWTKVEL